MLENGPAGLSRIRLIFALQVLDECLVLPHVEPVIEVGQPVIATARPGRARFQAFSSRNLPYAFCSAFCRTEQVTRIAISAWSRSATAVKPAAVIPWVR